jgi:hypothetical protein
MQSPRGGTRFAACLIGALLAGTVTAGPGPTAVFVVGHDEPSGDAFHVAATAYYRARLAPDDLLVTTARSWRDVRERLALRERHARTWGKIIVVAHGSEWTGLSVPLLPGEPPPLASVLAAVIGSGSFPPLPDGAVDAATELVIESCGVGRRPELLALYARLLAGSNGPALRVEASRGLVEFRAVREADDLIHTDRIEHVYSAHVLPAGGRDRRETMGTSLGPSLDAARRIPIEVVATLDGAPCRTRTPKRLASGSLIRKVLADYGLLASQLAWTLVPIDAARCELVGRAQILTDRPVPLLRVGN